jgi:hypothetical protein
MSRYVFIVNQTSLANERFVEEMCTQLRAKFGADSIAYASLLDPVRQLVLPFADEPKKLDSPCFFDALAEKKMSAQERSLFAADPENKVATQVITLAENAVVGFQHLLLVELLVKHLSSAEMREKRIVVVSDIRKSEDLERLMLAFPRALTLVRTNKPEPTIKCDSLTYSVLETEPLEMFKLAQHFNFTSDGKSVQPEFINKLCHLFAGV